MRRRSFLWTLLATPEAKRAVGYLLMSVAALCVGAASLLGPRPSALGTEESGLGTRDSGLGTPETAASHRVTDLPNESSRASVIEVWVNLADRSVLVAAMPSTAVDSVSGCSK